MNRGAHSLTLCVSRKASEKACQASIGPTAVQARCLFSALLQRSLRSISVASAVFGWFSCSDELNKKTCPLLAVLLTIYVGIPYRPRTIRVVL